MSGEMGGTGRSPSRGEESVDVGRWVSALRRSLPLMVAIVVVITVVVTFFSLVAAKSYRADAQLMVDPETSALASTDAASIERQLATLQSLVQSPTVLDAAAKRLGRPSGEVRDAVSASVDQRANLIDVVAEDSTARGAADIANAVARAFISTQAAGERRSLESAQGALTRQIDDLRSRGGAEVDEQVRALQERAAQLSVAQATAGSSLQLAREAEVPDQASAPRPFRNAVLALFASIFIAVLVALARDQLVPRVRDQREMGQLLELPVLVTIPESGGGFLNQRRAPTLARVEQEAYRTLSANLRLALPPDRQHVVLTTSAVHAEGKTSVTARLGRLLAQADHRTLLVSGDMRWPRLDSLMGIERRDGLSDLLAGAARDEVTVERLREAISFGAQRETGGLDVLPAGTRIGDDAAELLSARAIQAVFGAIQKLPYTYVLVDAPPLLGLADTPLLARHSEHMLVVSRLSSLKVSQVLELRETLDRLACHPLGLVVVGGRVEVSPYYSGAREMPEIDSVVVPR